MFKEDSLKDLLSLGLNVHNYSLISNYKELLEYQMRNHKFSVRFDSDTPHQKLPFYTYDDGHYNDGDKQYETGEEIIQLAKSMNCKLLCADGRKYDQVQICNFVYIVDVNKDYILELSFKKQPLRRMYDGNTIIIKGNLLSPDLDIISNNKHRRYLSKTLINNILDEIYTSFIINKWCECTLYPEPVGIRNNRIIYWQVI